MYCSRANKRIYTIILGTHTSTIRRYRIIWWAYLWGGLCAEKYGIMQMIIRSDHIYCNRLDVIHYKQKVSADKVSAKKLRRKNFRSNFEKVLFFCL